MRSTATASGGPLADGLESSWQRLGRALSPSPRSLSPSWSHVCESCPSIPDEVCPSMLRPPVTAWPRPLDSAAVDLDAEIVEALSLHSPEMS
jgi:hypothetical protein